MKENLVSIIVPVYNVATYIARCVKSICTQTYKNIEIILVNDGSGDNSYDICKNLAEKDERIILINQNNQGVVSSRNNGFEASKGDYILFVDADDWIEADMVEKLVEGIGISDLISSAVLWEKYPEKESYIKDEYEEGKYNTNEEKNVFFKKMIFDLNNHKLHPLTPWIWNKMYTRELIETVYRTLDKNIAFAEDTTFIYKCFFQSESFVITHKPYYHYCYNDNSVCHKEQRTILSDINKVYVSLYDDCKMRDKETALMEQLQTWIVLMTRVALNERMRLDVKTHVPEFLLDVTGLEKCNKIVVYGAGQAGQDYCYQLKKLGFNIVLWLDGNYKYWHKLGFDVSPPEEIKKADYDIVLLAVSDLNVMNNMKSYLVGAGVEEDKIVWKSPIWY